MNSDRPFWPYWALVLALTLGLGIGCSDDSGPTGNGGTAAGPLGDFSGALGETTEKYFDNNEPAFSSLQTFVPFIQTVLSVAPAAAGPVTSASMFQLQGCIDEAVWGTTFEYDFGQAAYFPGGMTGAPGDGVRFLLYEGQQARGHLDVRCPGDLPTINVTLAIEWDGITVYDMSSAGSINLSTAAWTVNSTGSLRDPHGSDVLSIESSAGGIGTQLVTSGFVYTDFNEGLSVQFGRNEQSGVLVGAFVLKGLSQQTFEWSLSLTYSGSSSQSLSGYVDLASLDLGSGLVACLSGSYESPTVSEASACADDLGFPIYPGVTAAHRSALRAGYDAMTQILGTLTAITQAGVEVAIPAVG